jgi:hypothetical protein
MAPVNTIFEERVEQLFSLADTVEKIFSAAGLEYRLVGGLAVYLYVESREADSGRITKDIDIAVRREDLDRIAEAARPFGYELRHVAGIDMLVNSSKPSARTAVHLIFFGEKVKQEAFAPTPDLGGCEQLHGLRLIPLEDLVTMKLTSFRFKDQAHLKDLEQAGLLSSELKNKLPVNLRERLEIVLRGE